MGVSRLLYRTSPTPKNRSSCAFPKSPGQNEPIDIAFKACRVRQRVAEYALQSGATEMLSLDQDQPGVVWTEGLVVLP